MTGTTENPVIVPARCLTCGKHTTVRFAEPIEPGEVRVALCGTCAVDREFICITRQIVGVPGTLYYLKIGDKTLAGPYAVLGEIVREYPDAEKGPGVPDTDWRIIQIGRRMVE